jgi:hypothetical protein
MRRSLLCAAVLLVLGVAALADDQEKAEKQIRMMTAMSRDDTARSIISRTFAEAFKMQRPQLVVERRNLGLNYGSLFLARELMQSGAQMNQIVEQLRAHKSMFEITNALHGDWKRIAADGKKMNSQIHDAIYKHFLHSKADEQRDQLEHYNASADLIRADADATNDEILKAQQEYVFWRNQAARTSSAPADPSSPLGRAYEQSRENIALTHGTTSDPTPGGR